MNELLLVIMGMKVEGDEIDVHLKTSVCPNNPDKQGTHLERIQENYENSGINFSFEFEENYMIEVFELIMVGRSILEEV